MPQLISLSNPTSWPSEVLDFLFASEDVLRGWYDDTGRTPAGQFDSTVYAFRPLIAPLAIGGFHCTRLTDAEQANIVADGLGLPDAQMLERRVAALLASGQVDQVFANRLVSSHLYDEPYRSGRIWFCFFAPRIAGESGIGELLGLWGGEATYRGVASDQRLSKIGTPCLVEATIRIAHLNRWPDFQMFRTFLMWRGMPLTEPTEFEAATLEPVPAANIVRIVSYPDAEFVTLTGCDTWRTKLST